MSAYAFFKPALRSVNSSGIVTYGPTPLYQQNSEGIYLEKMDLTYAEEKLGVWSNLSYSARWRHLGVRPMVTLSIKTVNASKTGLSTLLRHWQDGITSETYAGLQFTAFYDGVLADVWRGMVPTNGWEPKPIEGKWGPGYEVTLELSARDLITAPGDWRLRQW